MLTISPKPKLILTVGLPRSGKSTWAKRQGSPIICPDNIRFAISGQRFLEDLEPLVWLVVKVAIRSLFMSGHSSVILDACNNTIKRRKEWISTHWSTEVYYILHNAVLCTTRAKESADEEIVPVINRMYKEHEIPILSEGFTSITDDIGRMENTNNAD